MVKLSALGGEVLTLVSTSLDFPGIALMRVSVSVIWGALIDAALSRTHEFRSKSVSMSATQTSRSMDLKQTCVRKKAIAIQRIPGC